MCQKYLLQTPCVFHARPALLRLAVYRRGFELALGQAGASRFIKAPKARRLLNGRFHDLAVNAHQELQLHSAFFFQALGGAGILRLFAAEALITAAVCTGGAGGAGGADICTGNGEGGATG